MVLPAIMAGAAVAGAYMQYQNSEAARKASDAERQRIDELFAKLSAPDFDPTQIKPEEYQVVQKYIPQVAQYIEEVAPTVVKESEDMRAGLGAQRSALQRYKEIAANNGQDPQMQALLNEASRKGQIEAQSRQQSILQDANRHGMLGSGASLQAQLSGGADAMERGAQQGNQAAIEAYRGRLEALRNSADLGGQIRGQDVDLQSRNAAIINSFNQRTAANRQGFLDRNVDTTNAANKFNIGMIQDAANNNVTNRNAANQYNMDRADKNKQQKFANDYNILQGRAGQAATDIAATQRNAADRNQMIQGVSNIAGGLAKDYSASSAADADREERRKMAYYQKTGDKGVFKDDFDFDDKEASSKYSNKYDTGNIA